MHSFYDLLSERNASISLVNDSVAVLAIDKNLVRAYVWDEKSQSMVPRFEKRISEHIIFLSNVFHEHGILIYTIYNHVFWLDFETGKVHREHDEFWVNECRRYGVVYDDVKELALESKKYCMVERRDDENNVLGFYCVKSGSDYIYTTARATGLLECIESLPFTSQYKTRHILFWLSALILAVSLIIGLGRMIFSIRLTKTVRMVIMMAIIIMVTTGFYTMNIYNGQKQIATGWMEYQMDQIYNLTETFYQPMLKELDQKGIANFLKDPENQKILSSHISAMAHSGYFGEDNYCFIRLYLLDSAKNAYLISDSNRTVPIGKLCYTGSEVESFIQEPKSSLNGDGDTFQYTARFMPDEDGKPRFMFMNFFSTTTMNESQRNYGFTLFISLLSILIAVYISFSRLSNLRHNVYQYLKKRKVEAEDAKFSLCNTFNFVYKFSTDMDLFIQVYVVQYFANAPSDSIATMTATVLVCYSLGSVIGTVLIAWIRKALGNRLTGIVGSVLALTAFTMIIIALRTTDFHLFCTARFILGFAVFGMIRTVLEGLPLEADDINIRSRLIWSNITSQQAASVMAILAGGCIIEYLPPTVLYYMGMCLATVMLVLSYLTLSNAKQKIAGLGKRVFGEMRTFFTTRPVMRFIGMVTLPSLIMEGYTEYIFPLYASYYGFSAQMLTTIILLGITINCLAMPALDKIFAKMGNRRAIASYMLFLSVCLLLTIVSPGISWALIVFLLMLIIKKNGCESVYFTDLVDANGLDQQDSNVNYNIIECGILSLRPVLLRSFLSIGKNYASVLIGTLCGSLIGIYLLLKPDRTTK